MQDERFELAKDDSGFLNFASSGLDESSSATSNDVNVMAAGEKAPPAPAGKPADAAPPADSAGPPKSTSMDDHGQPGGTPTRPPSAEDGARALSPMSSDNGPDTASTDVGFDKPLPPTKTTGCEDLFKKPIEPVESISLGQVGQPAMGSAGAAAAAGVNPMSWVTLLYDYSQGTTMHGLPYITRGARFVIRRSIRLDILTGCSHYIHDFSYQPTLHFRGRSCYR